MARVVEARAWAAIWLSPIGSLGVQAGSSLIERDAWMGGVNVGGQLRMFDARR